MCSCSTLYDQFSTFHKYKWKVSSQQPYPNPSQHVILRLKEAARTIEVISHQSKRHWDVTYYGRKNNKCSRFYDRTIWCIAITGHAVAPGIMESGRQEMSSQVWAYVSDVNHWWTSAVCTWRRAMLYTIPPPRAVQGFIGLLWCFTAIGKHGNLEQINRGFWKQSWSLHMCVMFKNGNGNTIAASICVLCRGVRKLTLVFAGKLID